MIDVSTLETILREGRDIRLASLATYLDALPLETQNHWDCFICMLYDFAWLRDQMQQTQDQQQ